MNDFDTTAKQPKSSGVPAKRKMPKGTPFPPGVSGNPSGRPKGSKSITAAIRRMLDEGLEGRDLAEALAKAAISQALKGNVQFFQVILDRMDGKVADKIEGYVANSRPEESDESTLLARSQAVVGRIGKAG